MIVCNNCFHSWKKEKGDKNPYLCHVCGYDSENEKFNIDELKKWMIDKYGSLEEAWSQKYKNSIKKYHSSEKGVEARKKFQKTDSYKKSQEKYHQTEKFKEKQRKYFKSEKGRDAVKKYYSTDKGQKVRKRHNKIHHERIKNEKRVTRTK